MAYGIRPSKVARGMSLALVAVASLAPLTSCSPVSRFYARYSDGEVQILLCEDVEANELSLGSSEISDKYTPANDRDLWISSSDEDQSIPSGTIVTVGEEPPAFETTVRNTDPDPRTVILSFSAGHVEGGTLVRSKHAQFNGTKLSDDGWLDQDGNTHDRPC
jgi:hypothetical protein